MKILMIVILILLTVGMCAPSDGITASSTPLQQWQRYTVTGEEFSVSLPALPAMDSQTGFILAIRKNRTVRILGSYAEGVAYKIQTYENPEGLSLDQFIQEAGDGWEWKTATDLSLHGFQGRYFETTGPTTVGAKQFFRTKSHLYEFSVVGAPFDDPRVQQFFTSITLGKKVDGIELKDGIGFQPPDVDSVPVLSGKDVDRKVVLVIKPEPRYTEAARKEQITGRVVLRVVFASTGAVTNIRVTEGLPFGMVEQSIRAAKQIRFIPAIKNGQYVSMHMQLEYNFNLF